MMNLLRAASLTVGAITLAVVHAQDKTSCGSLFVAFGYPEGNDIYCYPFIDTDMQRYLAWYNGSTTITLTGNPSECPNETLGPISNALGIGGMTVPSNTTLDRTAYDTNPFYFWMPHTAGPNMSVSFQSSTDYYIEETQSWHLEATKSGDAYDVTGYWIGTKPTENFFYHASTKCWEGGDFWPNTWTESDGEHTHWNITGRLTADAATWTIDETWLTADGKEWHLIVAFEGNAYTDGPRLVTAETVPTTEGVLGANEEGENGASSTEGGGSGSSGSTSTSSSASGSSSANAGVPGTVDANRAAALMGVVAIFASLF